MSSKRLPSPSKRRLFVKKTRRACLELLLCGAVCCGIFALTGLPWSSKLPEVHGEEESRTRHTVSQSDSAAAATQLLERRRQQRARSNATIIAENLAAAASGFKFSAAVSRNPVSNPTIRRAASEQPDAQTTLSTPQGNHDAPSQQESIRCVLLGGNGAPAELAHSRIDDDYCDCKLLMPTMPLLSQTNLPSRKTHRRAPAASQPPHA